MKPLYQIAAQYQADFIALADMDEIDETTVANTLDAMEGEVVAKGANVSAYILNIEAVIDAMKSAERKMADRRKSAERQVEWMKSYLLRNMEACGIKEIEAADKSFRVRLMAGRESVVITDESSIPSEMMRTKTITEPDKVAIASAIKSGEHVSGAALIRKPALKFD